MKRGFIGYLGLGFGVLLLQGLMISSAGASTAPNCLDDSGNDISIDNAQVLTLKTTTANEYLSRAHVSGTVVALYPNETGHAHFGIQLDLSDSADLALRSSGGDDPGNSSPTLEVIYDLEFGAIPAVQVGDSIEACGDFINSFAKSGKYAASPDGAIIHWIHKSDEAKHPDGFLMINGTLYGQELPKN